MTKEVSFPNILNLSSPTSSDDFFPFLSFKTNAAGRRRGQVNSTENANFTSSIFRKILDRIISTSSPGPF